MAQDFKINSTTVSRITKGDWQDEPGDSQSLAGVIPLARWRRHRWQADVLSASEFNTLYALQGQKVKLTTVNYSDRNGDYIDYFGVDFPQISDSHDGPIFTGVSIDFLIRV